MKLTKDDFVKDENGTYRYNFSWLESQVDEILKNQEKAEKWDKHLYDINALSPLDIRLDDRQIVERLKKESEELDKSEWTHEIPNWKLKEYLQKILEGKDA